VDDDAVSSAVLLLLTTSACHISVFHCETLQPVSLFIVHQFQRMYFTKISSVLTEAYLTFVHAIDGQRTRPPRLNTLSTGALDAGMAKERRTAGISLSYAD